MTLAVVERLNSKRAKHDSKLSRVRSRRLNRASVLKFDDVLAGEFAEIEIDGVGIVQTSECDVSDFPSIQINGNRLVGFRRLHHGFQAVSGSSGSLELQSRNGCESPTDFGQIVLRVRTLGITQPRRDIRNGIESVRCHIGGVGGPRRLVERGDQ